MSEDIRIVLAQEYVRAPSLPEKTVQHIEALIDYIYEIDGELDNLKYSNSELSGEVAHLEGEIAELNKQLAEQQEKTRLLESKAGEQ